MRGMILRENATAKEATECLRRMRLRVQSGYTGTMFDAYMELVDELESQLGNCFEKDSVLQLLHTDRYWHVYQSGGSGTIVHHRAISQEREVLHSRLERLEGEFKLLEAWLGSGSLVLIDANSLMHYQQLDKIPWATELRIPGPVRLVVALAVVEELDRKKFEGGDSMRKRAASAIRSLYRLREGVGPDDPAQIAGPNGTKATLEIPRDDVGRTRMAGTDEELIAFGAFLLQAMGATQRVTLVTADMNLHIRAQRARLATHRLADKFAKDQPE